MATVMRIQSGQFGKGGTGKVVFQPGTAEAQETAALLVSKNGGAFATAASTIAGMSGESNVLQVITVVAADTSTTGPLAFRATGATDINTIHGLAVVDYLGTVVIPNL